MIFVQSLLKIADNSGGVLALCIGILSQSRMAKIGDTLVVSIKSIVLNHNAKKKKKVLKGSIHKAAFIRCRKILKRWGNYYVKGDSNSAVIIGNWGLPLGNRIYGPVFFEFRSSRYLKIAMLGEGTI